MRLLSYSHVRAWLALGISAACAVAIAMGTATQPASGASAGTVVGATVPSATAINVAGCASMAPNRTDFGAVTPGSGAVTTLDCSVLFESSNDTSRLRIRQTDRLGDAMYMPSRGQLDPAFDADGRVTTASAPTTGYEYAYAVAIQADGRIATAGSCDMGATGDDACLARYNANGSLDTTFDATGRVTTATAPAAGYDWANAIAVQPDGKMITAGECALAGATGTDACLARYNTDGSLDTTFDTDGRVTTATAPSTGTDAAWAMAMQADGRIVTAGRCDMGGTTGRDACLARYNPDGSLDTTFDTDGRVTTATAPTTGSDTVWGMVTQNDGRIVTAGRCDMGGTTGTDACLARYNTDGSLDTTFDTDGRVTTATAPAAGGDYAYAVAIQADGRIVIAGECVMGGATGTDACLASYDQGGRLEQYAGGVRDWTTPGTTLFAACLRSVAAATASWTANATCPASNGAHWNAVPATAAEVATAAIGIQGAANLRFGLRTAANQPPGAYIAPITFEVAAP